MNTMSTRHDDRRRPSQVALVAYPGCSLMELVGAHTIWRTAAMMSTLRASVVGATTEAIPSSTPLSFRAQQTFADATHPDVLHVPGAGPDAEAPWEDAELVSYVREAAEDATVVSATGTGSLVLAAAGLLRGRAATTHPAHRERLEALGAHYRRASRVEDGKFFTGQGASAALDLSLVLVARVRSLALARRAQIGAEWDPDPPFGPIDWEAVETARPGERSPGATEPTRIGLVIYEGLTVLDLVGPLEVLTALSRLRPEFVPAVVATGPGEVRSDSGVAFLPNTTFEALPAPDVLLVPGGGVPTMRAMSDVRLRRYLRDASAGASRTASVCTGALLLASVGLLEGRDATTHWAYRRYLPAFGARYVQRRWVGSGDIVNSAGVSAGIDMALHLVAELAGEATARQVQAALAYDPDPPFGGIDYGHLPPSMRLLRAVVALTVPVFARKPRRLLQAESPRR